MCGYQRRDCDGVTVNDDSLAFSEVGAERYTGCQCTFPHDKGVYYYAILRYNGAAFEVRAKSERRSDSAFFSDVARHYPTCEEQRPRLSHHLSRG